MPPPPLPSEGQGLGPAFAKGGTRKAKAAASASASAGSSAGSSVGSYSAGAGVGLHQDATTNTFKTSSMTGNSQTASSGGDGEGDGDGGGANGASPLHPGGIPRRVSITHRPPEDEEADPRAAASRERRGRSAALIAAATAPPPDHRTRRRSTSFDNGASPAASPRDRGKGSQGSEFVAEERAEDGNVRWRMSRLSAVGSGKAGEEDAANSSGGAIPGRTSCTASEAAAAAAVGAAAAVLAAEPQPTSQGPSRRPYSQIQQRRPSLAGRRADSEPLRPSSPDDLPDMDDMAEQIANVTSDGGYRKTTKEASIVLSQSEQVDRVDLLESIKWLGQHVPACVLETCSKEISETMERIEAKLRGAEQEEEEEQERETAGSDEASVDLDRGLEVGSDVFYDATSRISSSEVESLRSISSRNAKMNGSADLPYATRHDSALLFVDISGFTKLSTLLDVESLSEVGHIHVCCFCSLLVMFLVAWSEIDRPHHMRTSNPTRSSVPVSPIPTKLTLSPQHNRSSTRTSKPSSMKSFLMAGISLNSPEMPCSRSGAPRRTPPSGICTSLDARKREPTSDNGLGWT